MRSYLLLYFLLLSSVFQKFGYVNSEFILNSMPEYKEALSEIDNLSKAWEKEVSDMYVELEKKEIILKNEEILLTKEMYEEKRIQLDEEWKEARGYQQKGVWIRGFIFFEKKELIQPIQDILFESIENVAKKIDSKLFLINHQNQFYYTPILFMTTQIMSWKI